MRTISLAHLTLLHVPPPDLVRLAAAVGYDAVGLRLAPVHGRVDHAMLGSSAARKQTVRALADTGLRVLDAEVIRVRPGMRVTNHVALLEAAAELGAEHLVVTVEEPDAGAAADSFGALCRSAADHGMSCVLEFMIFSQVRTLAEARRIVEQAGESNSALLVDPLHLFRSGGSIADVAELPAELLPYIQLCDARDARPAVDPLNARAEAVQDRMLPGDGELPLAELVGVIPQGVAMSVEVPHRDGPAVDAKAYATEALAKTRALLGTGPGA